MIEWQPRGRTPDKLGDELSAKFSRREGGRLVGPSLYTPQHHHGYIDKPLFRFTPNPFRGSEPGRVRDAVLHGILDGDDIDGYSGQEGGWLPPISVLKSNRLLHLDPAPSGRTVTGSARAEAPARDIQSSSRRLRADSLEAHCREEIDKG
jgi:hypothetical protein